MESNASSSSDSRDDAPEPTTQRDRSGYGPRRRSLARSNSIGALAATSIGADLLATVGRQMRFVDPVVNHIAAASHLSGYVNIATQSGLHGTLADIGGSWPRAEFTPPMAEMVNSISDRALAVGSAEMALRSSGFAAVDVAGIAASVADTAARAPVLAASEVARSSIDVGEVHSSVLAQSMSNLCDGAQLNRLAAAELLVGSGALDAPWLGLDQNPVARSVDAFLDPFRAAMSTAAPMGDIARLAQVDLLSDVIESSIAWDWVPPIDPEGTEFGAFRLIEDDSAAPERRMQALNRIVDSIIWVPRSYEVRAALARRAREEGVSVRAIKWQELQAAVFLVLARKREPMFLRKGPQWLVLTAPDSQYVDWGTGGQRVPFEPWSLPIDEYFAWFRRETIKAAEASVLGKPYPSSADALERRVHQTNYAGWGDDDDGIPLPHDASSDPLLLLLDREHRREAQNRLLPALQRASPRTRQLLGLIARGMDVSTAARHLGIDPSTARVHLYRLRKKAM